MKLFDLVLRGLGLKIVASFSGLLLTSYLVLQFSPEVSGNVLFVYSVVFVIATFMRLGCDNLLVKTFSGLDEGRQEEFTGSLLNLHFLVSLLLLLLMLSAALLATSVFAVEVSRWVYTAILISPMYSLGFLCGVLLIARGAVLKGIVAKQLAFPFVLIVVVTIVSIGLKNYFSLDSSAIISLFLSALIYSLVCLWVLRVQLDWKPLTDTYQDLSSESYFSQAPYYLMSTLSSQMLQWVSPVFVGVSYSSEQLSGYTLSLRLAQLCSFGFMVANTIFLKKISDLVNNQDVDGLFRLLKLHWFLSFVPSLVVWTVLYFYSDRLLLAYGEYYSEFQDVIIWLAAGQLVNSITGPCSHILQLSRMYKVQTAITLVGGLLFIVVGLLSVGMQLIEFVKFVFVIIAVQNIVYMFCAMKVVREL